jgi:hypothetical protein
MGVLMRWRANKKIHPVLNFLRPKVHGGRMPISLDGREAAVKDACQVAALL